MMNGDCAILTAFRRRDENGDIIPRTVNRERNRKLLFDLNSFGYGPILLFGAYDEEVLDKDGEGTGNFERVQEESWFVPELFGDESALENIIELAKKYDQDAIVHITHPIERENEQVIEANLIGTADNRSIGTDVFPIGVLTLEKISGLYSQIGKTKFAFAEKPLEEAAQIYEVHKRAIRPDGLANAYAKREIQKKVVDRHTKEYK